MRALHKVGAGAMVAALTGALLVVLPLPVAFAHGSTTFPASRTYACYVDGLAGGNGGDLFPTNPACQDAFLNGPQDHFAFWNWFGNLLSNAGGNHRQIIPDGNLCGPQDAFAKFRAGRQDWPTTGLQPGASVTFRYNAWAPHPGTWTSYVTRDGWNPDQPLKWSDLEATPFNTVTNPPLDGTGPLGKEYTWPVTLPANKSGRHIIYTIMQRSDSPEAFYNCSDVWFGPGAPPPPPPPPPPPATTCTVSYAITANWNNGFNASVTVTNTGTIPVNGWTVRWAFPNDQVITQFWDSDIAQTGQNVVANNARYNLHIDPGKSVTFGFQGSHGAANDPPPSLTACRPATGSAATVASHSTPNPFLSYVFRLVSMMFGGDAQPAAHQHGG